MIEEQTFAAAFAEALAAGARVEFCACRVEFDESNVIFLALGWVDQRRRWRPYLSVGFLRWGAQIGWLIV